MDKNKTIINFLVFICFVFLLYIYGGVCVVDGGLSYMTSRQRPCDIHVESIICMWEEHYIHDTSIIEDTFGSRGSLSSSFLLLLQKYLVDKKSNGYCFFLYARNLSITWAADSRYWQWPYLKETRYLVLSSSPCHSLGNLIGSFDLFRS